MSIIPFTGRKTILIITDDVLSIYSSGIAGMNSVADIEWESDDFSSRLFQVLKKDCKSSPIIVLNDMVEQHYRKERVRRSGVSIMDKGNILKRKLRAAFPSYPIRAALPIKEGGGQGGFNSYIFVALPESKKLQKLVNVIQSPDFTVQGLHLLPVEASDMVNALSDRLLKRRKQKKTGWTIFIGQHESGSLRQIVTRNGELALTRMTPVSDMHEKPENWVMDAHQEFKATMSYLTRFGYEQSDGLNVVVISGDEEGQNFENLIQEECVYDSINVSAAAALLGLRVNNDPGLNYADMLHVGWVAKKSKLVLPMSVPELERVAAPRKTAAAVSALLLIAAGLQGYQAYSGANKYSTTTADIKQTTIRKTQINEEYEVEVAKLKDQGYDIKLLQGSLDLYNRLEREKPDVLALLKEIGSALEGNLRLNNVNIKVPKDDLAERIRTASISLDPAPLKTLYTGKLTIIYPSTTNIDQGNRQVTELRDRIKERLPKHTVQVSKYLKDYEYTEQMVVESGASKTEGAEQDFVVEITIEGKEEGGENAQ